jgi:hypothetical protein
MRPATKVPLRLGRVYRTREFAAWSKNTPRLVKRLVRDGALVPLAQGLYVHPRKGRFGSAPPGDAELMRSFLGERSFVFTGSDRWNALGLGTTAVSPVVLVYNKKRTVKVRLGGRPFDLRRVAFPEKPCKEWFVVDLLENADQAGASRAELAEALTRAASHGTFNTARLREMAERYGTRRTQKLVGGALAMSASA